MLSGTVLYATPHERLELGPGAAGFVNANVLHMTRAVDGRPGVDLLIHEFRPRLIAEPRSLLWSRYVELLTSTTSIELFATGPGDSATRGLRETLRSSFDVVEEGAPGWELRVRDAISEVWLGFVGLLGPRLPRVRPRCPRRVTSACARCSTSWAPTTPSASACGTWRPLPLRASASATAPFARSLE